jgi:hypothetical protein
MQCPSAMSVGLGKDLARPYRSRMLHARLHQARTALLPNSALNLTWPSLTLGPRRLMPGRWADE